MINRETHDAKENCLILTCPHCGTMTNRTTLGLCWDFGDHCCRCFICGYRGYEHLTQPRTGVWLEMWLGTFSPE